MRIWTNKSLRALAGDSDPIEFIVGRARGVLFKFFENGGDGPPIDPIELANFLGIKVEPSEGVRDASTTFRSNEFKIEYNPNRPTARVRYSIAHEIAHTFFPDCQDMIRNRARHEDLVADEWQLEMLCNVAAAEILMPLGSFPELREDKVSIENLLQLQKHFQVSVEALLLRFRKLTEEPLLVFSASRENPDKTTYKIDYSVSSDTINWRLRAGTKVPKVSIVTECTAIGFTKKSEEDWIVSEPARIECVGIPAYPGQIFPRVMGIVRPVNAANPAPYRFKMIRGDATRPGGIGKKIIGLIVNDATPRWGAGFALAIRRKWPAVQKDFIAWSSNHSNEFRLGSVNLVRVDDSLLIAPIIAQRGYGPSRNPRIRYEALRAGLINLAKTSEELGASLHFPKIGSGEAKGNWSIIEEMMRDIFRETKAEVTIYELPGSMEPATDQPELDFSS